MDQVFLILFQDFDFGKKIINQFLSSGSIQTIDISNSTSMARGDDNFEILNMNFQYSFFKTNYTQLTVSTNGFLFFASPFSSCCNIIRPDHH